MISKGERVYELQQKNDDEYILLHDVVTNIWAKKGAQIIHHLGKLFKTSILK